MADSVMMVEPEEVEGLFPYQRTTAAITTGQGSIIAKSLTLNERLYNINSLYTILALSQEA